MQKNLKQYASLLRPHQWLKNLLLLFPPFFGGKIMAQSVRECLVPSLVSFSLAASCCYIINDIKDRHRDRHHAVKQKRPIACGGISPALASVTAAGLYLAAMVLGGAVSARFQGYLVIYFFLNVLYTLFFKDVVILDIFLVAFGFIVRVKAGGEAFQVAVSNWLFLTVLIVAMFLTTGKRLGELISEGENAARHRMSLAHYSASFLEGILWFAASASLVMYSLYIIENQNGMIYTVPVAAFGLLRYIYIVKEGKGEPTEALLHDKQIMATGILWVAMIGAIIYK